MAQAVGRTGPAAEQTDAGQAVTATAAVAYQVMEPAHLSIWVRGRSR